MSGKNIDPRWVSEQAYHDDKYTEMAERKYHSLGFNRIIFNDIFSLMGDIEGKKILEIGCGMGWLTKILAGKGAEIWAFDISLEAIKNAKDFISKSNLDGKVHFDQMSAEQLSYDSSMFDVVIGNAILHHVDLASTTKEIKRVMKEDGIGLFIEPLGHNPLLNLYRLLTPNLRSEDERPLLFDDFQLFEEHFDNFDHREYYFTTMLSLLCYPLGFNNLMIRSRDLLHAFDAKILSVLPSLRKQCWYTTLILKN